MLSSMPYVYVMKPFFSTAEVDTAANELIPFILAMGFAVNCPPSHAVLMTPVADTVLAIVRSPYRILDVVNAARSLFIGYA